MTGKTISTTISHSVTIGSSYPSPLTITSTGAIGPTAYGVVGLYLPAAPSLVSVFNHGVVVGGPGGVDQNDFVGLLGGTAIDIHTDAVLNNTGRINGGGGGSSDEGGYGGLGIDVCASATIVNSGLIAGGAGGYGHYGGGAGGVGIDLAVSATLTNSGTVQGGAGADSYVNPSGMQGVGGIAVSTASEAVISNSGVIVGGLGGAGGSYQQQNGDLGGDALILGSGGTLTNSSTIIGGGGGNSGLGSLGGGGGIGVYVAAASVSNTGLIAGGAGGYVAAEKYISYGGRGGAGLNATSYAVVSNKGRILGGAGGGYEGGGFGGDGVIVSGGATVTNGGHIYGGSGGGASNYFLGGNGGGGVSIGSGTFINNGTVIGGAGGYASAIPAVYGPSQRFSGNGGAGVFATIYANAPSGISLANYGVITGGIGGSLTAEGTAASYGTAGTGGAGVALTGASLANHGTITGGVGGYSGPKPGLDGVGGIGGAGVLLTDGAQLTNSGTITGGVGGTNVEVGVSGGAGVVIAGGTFTDSGIVRGGAGGAKVNNGLRGDAVYFYGSVAGTLVLNPGAVLTGSVVSEGSALNVLELAGTATTTLSGFGTEFVNIPVLSFASGAQRIVEGSIAGFHAIDGLAAHDAIVLDGYTATLPETTITGNEIVLFNSLGGTTLDVSHPTAKDFLLTDGGGKTTIAAALGTLAHTIGSGAAQFVLTGGLSTGSKLVAGGLETVANNGTAASTTIAGGKLVLEVGAKIANGVSFAASTGTLTIDSVHMPASTISGFIAGDTIGLAGVAYNPADRVTVATAGIVTVVTPGASYNLQIAGATVGETDFRFGSGSLLTKTAPPKMAFLAPAEAAALPVHALAPTGRSAGGWFAPLSATQVPGAAGGGLPIGTLHSLAAAGFSEAWVALSEPVRFEMAGLAHRGDL